MPALLCSSGRRCAAAGELDDVTIKVEMTDKDEERKAKAVSGKKSKQAGKAAEPPTAKSKTGEEKTESPAGERTRK